MKADKTGHKAARHGRVGREFVKAMLVEMVPQGCEKKVAEEYNDGLTFIASVAIRSCKLGDGDGRCPVGDFDQGLVRLNPRPSCRDAVGDL